MQLRIGNFPKNSGAPRAVKLRIDEHDLVDLYGTLCIILVPLLTAFKAASTHGIMGGAYTLAQQEFGVDDMSTNVSDAVSAQIMARGTAIQDEWLSDMIYAFTRMRDDAHDHEVGDNPCDDPRVKRGLELFAREFRSLWL